MVVPLWSQLKHIHFKTQKWNKKYNMLIHGWNQMVKKLPISSKPKIESCKVEPLIVRIIGPEFMKDWTLEQFKPDRVWFLSNKLLSPWVFFEYMECSRDDGNDHSVEIEWKFDDYPMTEEDLFCCTWKDEIDCIPFYELASFLTRVIENTILPNLCKQVEMWKSNWRYLIKHYHFQPVFNKKDEIKQQWIQKFETRMKNESFYSYIEAKYLEDVIQFFKSESRKWFYEWTLEMSDTFKPWIPNFDPMEWNISISQSFQSSSSSIDVNTIIQIFVKQLSQQFDSHFSFLLQ